MVDSVVRARSEVEAAWLLAEGRGGTRVVAGGTDLMLQLETGRRAAKSLVDVRRSGMGGQSVGEQELRLGATRTVQDILEDAWVREHLPALGQAAAAFASPQIRNMGTVGGNIVNASPAADLVPCLVAADARAVIRRGDECREVLVREVLLGPGRVSLDEKDLLAEVVVPLPASAEAWTHQRFLKLGYRKAQVITVVSVCLLARVVRGVVERAALALGSVGPTVLRAGRAEAFLLGKALDREVMAEAGALCAEEARPIDDQRASAAYRREVVRRYTCRALAECAATRAA
jgi:xanthine dehydrogenase FAD-binding subunit